MAVYLRDIASMQSYQMNSACFREMSFNQDPELELLVYQRQYHALHQRLRGTTVAPSNNASDDNAESTASSRRKDPNYLTITVKMAIFIGGGFTKEWMTCLEYAAWKGDWKLACVLVANGADPQYNSFTGFRASTTNIQDTRRRRYKPVGPPPFVSLNGTTTIPGFAGLRAVVEDDLKNREQMLAFLWLLERCFGSSVPAPDNVRRVKELASSSSRTTPLKTVLSTPQQQPDANTVRQDFAKIVSCLQLVCLEHQDPEPGRNCDDSASVSGPCFLTAGRRTVFLDTKVSRKLNEPQKGYDVCEQSEFNEPQKGYDVILVGKTMFNDCMQSSIFWSLQSDIIAMTM